MLTLLNWNLEWKKVNSRPGREIIRMISAVHPNIICLAETYDEFLDPSSWHSVYPDGDSGYPTLEGRRLLSDLLDKFELVPPKHVEHRTICHTLLSSGMSVIAMNELPAKVGGLRMR